MPNHISNRLTLGCTAKRAKEVFAAIGSMNDGEKKLIDFDTLIPYPEHFTKLDRAANEWEKDHPENPYQGRPRDGYNQGGYEWCCENWGTKWNAYHQQKRGPRVVYFDTAWSAPEPVMDAFAAKFPDIAFTLEYADEDIGENAGYFWYGNDGSKAHVTCQGADAVRLWFDLNPDCDPREYGFDPVSFDQLPTDSAMLF